MRASKKTHRLAAMCVCFFLVCVAAARYASTSLDARAFCCVCAAADDVMAAWAVRTKKRESCVR